MDSAGIEPLFRADLVPRGVLIDVGVQLNVSTPLFAAVALHTLNFAYHLVAAMHDILADQLEGRGSRLAIGHRPAHLR